MYLLFLHHIFTEALLDPTLGVREDTIDVVHVSGGWRTEEREISLPGEEGHSHFRSLGVRQLSSRWSRDLHQERSAARRS